MLSITQPYISLLLATIVLVGQLPALLHRVGCVELCAVSWNVDYASNEKSAQDRSFGQNSKRNTCCVEYEACSAIFQLTCNSANGNFIESVGAIHDCDDCTLCQSLHSASGIALPYQVLMPLVRIQRCLATTKTKAPILECFSLFQSRAPPAAFA